MWWVWSLSGPPTAPVPGMAVPSCLSLGNNVYTLEHSTSVSPITVHPQQNIYCYGHEIILFPQSHTPFSPPHLCPYHKHFNPIHKRPSSIKLTKIFFQIKIKIFWGGLTQNPKFGLVLCSFMGLSPLTVVLQFTNSIYSMILVANWAGWELN